MITRALSTFVLRAGILSGLGSCLLAPHAGVAQGFGSRTSGEQPGLAQAIEIKRSASGKKDASIETGPGYWHAQGLDLRALLAEAFRVDPDRIDIPETPGPESLYDVSLRLRDDQSPEAAASMLRAALQAKLGVSVAVSNRVVPVYLLTAPKGAGPALHAHREADEQAPQLRYEGQSCPGIYTGSISAVAASMAEFGRTWESQLGRPVVDETHLAGSYDFSIAKYRSKEDLFARLSSELGLVVVPAEREVQVLHVTPAVSETNVQLTARLVEP